ncbi:MAG: hypothetical protein K8S23_12430 [Candidatus Cloacimonetes bacterium]|nr:hypothetical protein [Candidatus Cloacimonadota bacterium]
MKSYLYTFTIFILFATIIGCSKPTNDLMKIAVSQFSSSKLGEDSENGVKFALKEAGYISGENCIIEYKNAQGDFSTAQSIARKFVADKVDYIITITTPCLQVTAIENKKIPHIFGSVTDPFRMGIADGCIPKVCHLS